MELASGHRLGVYEIVARLGAGGMGEVWRAKDPRLEREVALKVLPASNADDPAARARLLREARLASRLNHPSVCTVHDVGEIEGKVYIAMELVAGEALSARIARGALPLRDVMRLGTQIAQAIAHAQEHGLVHRDLKSANVVVTPEGRAKVLDFGLAARLPGTALSEATTGALDSAELAGRIVGTLPYMAPEQLRGGPADARSDVWSLGVLLYEMAAGRRPFGGDSQIALTSDILTGTPPPLPPGPAGGLPAHLQQVIDRCLEKEPGRRYQRAGEVHAALEAVHWRTRSGLERTPEVPHRGARRWLPPALGVGMVLAMVAAFLTGGDRFRGTAIDGDRTRAVRLAVLPFVNLNGDPDQEYLADGLTEDMIGQLGRLHPAGLAVIARTSVMRYKGGGTPIDRFARELGVDYVLAGSARWEGERVRIVAELVQAANQTQLWTETYDRELSGILAMQSEVAQQVAHALALELLPGERTRLASARSVEPEAYDAYLRGTFEWQKLTREGFDAAEHSFERALAADPAYAPAYEGLAWVWSARKQMGITPAQEAGPKCVAAAQRAVALDPGSAGAHEALAMARTWTEWDWEGAGREWRRALELNPNSANTHAYYGHFLAIVGRLDEALPHGELSLQLDPYNSLFHALYAVLLNRARRFDDAMARALTALSMQPTSPVAHQALLDAYGGLGMRDEELAARRAWKEHDPEWAAALREGEAEAGYEGAMRRVAELLARRYQEGTWFAALPVSRRFCKAGEYEAGLDWLERAYANRDPGVPYDFGGDPRNDAIRDHPRFRDLAARIGLPAVPADAPAE